MPTSGQFPDMVAEDVSRNKQRIKVDSEQLSAKGGKWKVEREQQQIFGEYVMIPCAKTAGKEEKLQAVEKGLLRLLEGLRTPWLVPDFGAMEFLIREGTHSTKNLSWQIDEPDDLEEVISVAIRYKSEKGEQP